MDGLGATRRSSKKLVFPFYALSHGLASSRERNEQATSIGKGLCLLVQTVPPAFLSVRVSFYRIGKRRDLRTVWRRESPAPRRHASVVTFNPRRSQASTPLPSFFFFFLLCYFVGTCRLEWFYLNAPLNNAIARLLEKTVYMCSIRDRNRAKVYVYRCLERTRWTNRNDIRNWVFVRLSFCAPLKTWLIRDMQMYVNSKIIVMHELLYNEEDFTYCVIVIST